MEVPSTLLSNCLTCKLELTTLVDQRNMILKYYTNSTVTGTWFRISDKGEQHRRHLSVNSLDSLMLKVKCSIQTFELCTITEEAVICLDSTPYNVNDYSIFKYTDSRKQGIRKIKRFCLMLHDRTEVIWPRKDDELQKPLFTWKTKQANHIQYIQS